MESLKIVLVLLCVVILSVYSVTQVFSVAIEYGESPAELYNKAMKVNPSCADWCADLGAPESYRCLAYTIERGYCRK